MSVSKSWTQDPANISAVLAAYRNDPPLIVAAIATNLGTTAHNISHVLEKHMSASELKARKALRYSITKEGERNPMKGKTKEQHHNWIGECSDCKGYLTILHNGVRQFVHRVVMAEALGLPMLPEQSVFQMLRLLRGLQKRLESNANVRLLMESFLIQLRDLK